MVNSDGSPFEGGNRVRTYRIRRHRLLGRGYCKRRSLDDQHYNMLFFVAIAATSPYPSSVATVVVAVAASNCNPSFIIVSTSNRSWVSHPFAFEVDRIPSAVVVVADIDHPWAIVVSSHPFVEAAASS